MEPASQTPADGFGKRLRMALEMIKFEHSVFALPFALTGALLALGEVPAASGNWRWKLGWIVAAIVGARSAAMTFNRLADASIDARNPRTANRHLPAGTLSRRFAWGLLAAGVAVFLLAARALNPLCFRLAPLVLAVVFLYSYTKRFTALSHLVLGFALGMAPAAAWIAMTGALDARILWLTAAVTCWTAGFDIIYSCQDYDFDRRERLFSLPARLGIGGALWVARALHAGMLGCLLALAAGFHLGWLSLCGVGVVATLLVFEHRLVKAGDLSRVNAAFFTVNGWVSMLFFVFWAADVWLARRGA